MNRLKELQAKVIEQRMYVDLSENIEYLENIIDFLSEAKISFPAAKRMSKKHLGVVIPKYTRFLNFQDKMKGEIELIDFENSTIRERYDKVIKFFL